MARRLYSLLNTSASAMGSGSKCAPISADCPAADAGVLRERAAFWSPVLFVACPDSNHRGKKFLISRNWNTRVVVCVWPAAVTQKLPPLLRAARSSPSTSIMDRNRYMTFTDCQSSPATMRWSGVHDTLQTNPGKPRPINPMAGAFSFGLAFGAAAPRCLMASTSTTATSISIGRRSARCARDCVGSAGRKRPLAPVPPIGIFSLTGLLSIHIENYGPGAMLMDVAPLGRASALSERPASSCGIHKLTCLAKKCSEAVLPLRRRFRTRSTGPGADKHRRRR
jgi:hypothetical protein